MIESLNLRIAIIYLEGNNITKVGVIEFIMKGEWITLKKLKLSIINLNIGTNKIDY